MKKLLLFGAISFSINAFSQLPSYVPTSGLIAWYGFSGNANDESGNGNNGTVNGATLTSDRFGNPNSAYSFNGSSDYIDINSVNDSLLTEFSYFGWIYVSGSNGNWQSIVNTRFGHVATVDSVLLGANYTSNNGGNPAIRLDEDGVVGYGGWHSFAMTATATEVNLFIDGNWIGISGNSYNYNDLYLSSEIGANGRTNQPRSAFFNGAIDDLGIWNRVIDSCEITTLHTGTSCNVGIEELTSQPKELIKIVNLLGQKVEYIPNTVLIYIYSDGSTERVYNVE